MSVSFGPNRGLIINALTGDNFDVSFRAMLRALDALLVVSVLSRAIATPPASPANGDRYIVAASPTGAWVGHTNAIAIWTTDNPAGSTWEFYAAATGMDVWSVADGAFYGWNGTAWVNVSTLQSYTVATLPAGSAGMVAYASNGRKVGEGAGLGTGVPVYFSNGSWRVSSTDAAVAA